MVTGIIGLAAGGDEDGWILYFLPGYLFGAACAVGLAYCLIGMMSPLPRSRWDDDYDDYDDQPRTRRRYDEDEDEDDEDRPRRSRRLRDDDEADDDDIPRRRRRRRGDDY
jgi:hypothetical protein